MVFKTLIKKSARLLEPGTIHIYAQGRLYISRDLMKKFKGAKRVLVLVDADYNKLALIPTDEKDQNGYVIQKKGANGQVQVVLLERAKIKGKFKARFTEGKIIIDDVKVKNLEGCRFKEDEEW